MKKKVKLLQPKPHTPYSTIKSIKNKFKKFNITKSDLN